MTHDLPTFYCCFGTEVLTILAEMVEAEEARMKARKEAVAEKTHEKDSKSHEKDSKSKETKSDAKASS